MQSHFNIKVESSTRTHGITYPTNRLAHHCWFLDVYCYNSQFVFLSICLSGNFSQAIGSKGLKCSWFVGGHPGVVIEKFGLDRSVVP